MEPLFFGPSEHLYGVYHAPQRVRSDNAGVLLCYPVGQEYIRIHRAYRWLADRLASAGFHVLRFDYSGQGDSAGRWEEITLRQWVADAQMALTELVTISGAAHVDVVGVRLGSVVAADLLRLPPARRAVLWEPRSAPAAYVQEMARRSDLTTATVASLLDAEGRFDMQGFSYPGEFLIDVCAWPAPAPLRTQQSALLLSAEPVPQLAAMVAALGAEGGAVEHAVVASATDWNSVDDMGGIFLPLPSLQRIVEWLDGRA